MTAPLDVHFTKQTIPVFARWFGSWQISVQRLAYNAPELSRLYDQAALTWGQTINRLGFPHAYEMLIRRILSENASAVAGTRPRILDCGVGTGALSSALARVVCKPFALDAIDISPIMLERARHNLRAAHVSAKLRQGDACSLPYDDGTFDVVMTAHMLEHFADPRAALDEMVRVLKPGGLLIACLTRRSPLGLYVHFKWRTHRFTAKQARNWLFQSGLNDARCLSFDDRAMCRQLSMACVGLKPDLAAARSNNSSFAT